MSLTTKDVRLQGYPSFELILSHFDALPVLVEACRQHCPEALVAWDAARNMAGPPRALLPLTRHAAKVLENYEDQEEEASHG